MFASLGFLMVLEVGWWVVAFINSMSDWLVVGTCDGGMAFPRFSSCLLSSFVSFWLIKVWVFSKDSWLVVGDVVCFLVKCMWMLFAWLFW